MGKNEPNQNDNAINFSGLILGFGSAALTHMGLTQHGQIDKNQKNLELARQNIEIIELLAQKTKGNLTTEEQQLTEHILADLRMKYVETSK